MSGSGIRSRAGRLMECVDVDEKKKVDMDNLFSGSSFPDVHITILWRYQREQRTFLTGLSSLES